MRTILANKKEECEMQIEKTKDVINQNADNQINGLIANSRSKHCKI
jgi:hypothetical protein